MAAQTIDKALFEAYFDQLLVEKRGYFKELLTEIIDEKLSKSKSNKAVVSNSDILELVATYAKVPNDALANEQEHDPFARENLMQHFDKILKEDHNLLLRLAQ